MAGMPDRHVLRVAHWDGAGWRRMGDGLDAAVHAIAIVGDDVYVGGEFTAADGAVEASRLARWDGTAWSPVDGGVSDSRPGSLASVRALASDGDAALRRRQRSTRWAPTRSPPTASRRSTWPRARGRPTSGGLWFRRRPRRGPRAGAGRRRGSTSAARSIARAAWTTGSLAALDPATGRWEGFGAGLRQRRLRRHGRQPRGRRGHGHGLRRRQLHDAPAPSRRRAWRR